MDDRAGRRSGTMVSWAALITSIVALVVSASGIAGASARHAQPAKPNPVVRLGKNGLISSKLIPEVRRAKMAQKLAPAAIKPLTAAAAAAAAPSCLKNTVDLGSWCLMENVYALTPAEAGQNNYFFATQVCTNMGGYLPSAGQLIGAAPLVSLESTIDDNPNTAIVESDPTVGLQDQREMSSTLVTTSAGSDAAGSEGVSSGSTGNPAENQPDPTPQPSNPQPSTLQYVTVYDNHNAGGFAGSEPVTSPENFRCGFSKIPGGDEKTQIPLGVAATG